MDQHIISTALVEFLLYVRIDKNETVHRDRCDPSYMFLDIEMAFENTLYDPLASFGRTGDIITMLGNIVTTSIATTTTWFILFKVTHKTERLLVMQLYRLTLLYGAQRSYFFFVITMIIDCVDKGTQGTRICIFETKRH